MARDRFAFAVSVLVMTVAGMAASFTAALMNATCAYADSSPSFRYRVVIFEFGLSGVGLNNKGEALVKNDSNPNEGSILAFQGGSLTKTNLNFEPSAINDEGQVVGCMQMGSVSHAVIWDKGKTTDLGTLGGESSCAEAVNNRGQVVGWADTKGGRVHGFRWSDGQIVDLSVPSGFPESKAVGINDQGVIIGSGTNSDGESHGAIWQNGQRTYVDADTADFEAVNASGQVLRGGIDDAGFICSVLQNGVVQAVTSSDPKETCMQVAGINDRAEVVGTAMVASGPMVGFVWTSGTMTDLRHLLDPQAMFFLAMPRKINDQGVILATGNVGDFGAPTHDALLIPLDLARKMGVHSSAGADVVKADEPIRPHIAIVAYDGSPATMTGCKTDILTFDATFRNDSTVPLTSISVQLTTTDESGKIQLRKTVLATGSFGSKDSTTQEWAFGAPLGDQGSCAIVRTVDANGTVWAAATAPHDL